MPVVDTLTPDDIGEFIVTSKWKFARTMPTMPHEYTLREHATNIELFESFILHVRKHGYPHRFWRKVYQYFDFAGYHYWTMGAPLAETILINRAMIT